MGRVRGGGGGGGEGVGGGRGRGGEEGGALIHITRRCLISYCELKTTTLYEYILFN